MAEVNQLIVQFNDQLYDMAKKIARACPTSIIGQNIDFFEDIISKAEHRTKFIDLFMARVLKHREQIDNFNENYFLQEHNYDEDLKKEGYQKWTDRVFEFKSIWKKLDDITKKQVFLSMQILCMYAEDYFKILYPPPKQ